MMIRFFGLFLGLVLFGTTADARDFKEIPLPSNIRIVAATQDLPADEAFFLGVWEGKWGESLPSVVDITNIDPKSGDVKGYYGWGDGRNFKAGSTDFTGKIGLGKRNNKVLKFKVRAAKVSFRVPKRGGDILKGKYDLSGRLSEGMFHRTDLN